MTEAYLKKVCGRISEDLCQYEQGYGGRLSEYSTVQNSTPLVGAFTESILDTDVAAISLSAATKSPAPWAH
jgi:hypothetical protein